MVNHWRHKEVIPQDNIKKNKDLNKKWWALDFSSENDKWSEIELKNIVIWNIEWHYENPSNWFHYQIKNWSIVCKKWVLTYSNNWPKLSFIFEEFELYDWKNKKIKSYKWIDYSKIKWSNLKTWLKLENPNFFILNLDYSWKTKVIKDEKKEILITKFSINLSNWKKLTYDNWILWWDENLLDRTMFVWSDKTTKLSNKTISAIWINSWKISWIIKKD